MNEFLKFREAQAKHGPEGMEEILTLSPEACNQETEELDRLADEEDMSPIIRECPCCGRETDNP